MPSPARSQLFVGGMNEADAIRKNYQVLRIKHEKTEEKLSEFRDKLKDVRAELTAKDRQLDVAKRMIQRINEEKNQFEMQAEQNKAQAKKLEVKLMSAQEPVEAQAKLQQYRIKVSEQKDELRSMESRMRLAEETNLQMSHEVHVLKRAMGLKNGLSEGALDSQSRLLHQLSKSQEQSTSLAVQLAELQKQVTDLQDQLQGADAEIYRLQESRAQLDSKLDESRQQVSEALESASLFRREAEQAHTELKHMQLTLEEVAASKGRSEQQLRVAEQQSSLHLDKSKQLTERLQSMERASRLSIEALRTEVTIAVERAESRAAEQRASWAVKEAGLSEQCLILKKELDDVHARLREEQQQHSAEIRRLRQGLHSQQEEEDQLKRTERDQVLEIGRLHGQLDTFSELNRDIKARLDAAEDRAAQSSSALNRVKAELVEEQELSSSLKAQVKDLTTKVLSLQADHDTREREMELKVEKLRQDLASASIVKERFQADLQLARRQVNEDSLRSGNMDAYVQELHHTVENLTESKNKLQAYMLEQISLFKSKLESAEDENRELRLAFSGIRATSPPVRGGSSPYAWVGTKAATRLTSPRSGLYQRALAATRQDENSEEDEGSDDGYGRSPPRMSKPRGTRYQPAQKNR